MLTDKQVKNVASLALKASKADQTEVILIGFDSALTRFANSAIHQNVVQRDTAVTVRAVVGKRIGMASANSLEPEAVLPAGKKQQLSRGLNIVEEP